MIFTERTITVRKGMSKIDEPVILYRGDYEVEVRFTIIDSKFRFLSGVNIIDNENAAYAQLAILTPYGGNIFSEITRCNEGTVTFLISADMLNQIEEVGLYSFQIRLFDFNRESRVSIPPVEFGLEFREPITSEDHDNSVNNAIVGYSIAKFINPGVEEIKPTFDEDGAYNKTEWETGDRITQGKLNKVEDAISKINQNEKNDIAILDKKITNNFNVLDSIKADKTEVRLKSTPNTLNDCDEEMIAAIQNKEGETTFNLTSIPKDGSVTFAKLDQESLNNITEYVQLDVEIVEGYYDKASTYDELNPSSSYQSIRHACREGERYNCDCRIDTEHLAVVMFYRENGTQLSRLNTGVINTYYNFEFVVPKEACYLTITSTVSAPPVLRKLQYVNVHNIRDDVNALTKEIDYDKILKTVISEVHLTESNTELLQGKIYTAGGGFQTIASFSTLYYKLSSNTISVNLKSIHIGDYGGAFVTENKSWISSFKTNSSNVEMAIPANAYYIAISVRASDLYSEYFYITEEVPYIRFNNLDSSNIDMEMTNPGNHWKNKKILWLGTSVSFGQYATKSYVKEACDILKCDFLNVSVPGLAIHTNNDGSQRTYGSLALSKKEYAEQGVTISSNPVPYTPGGSYNNYYRTYENVFNDTTADYDLYVFDVAPNNGNFGLGDWDAFDKDNWVYTDGSDFSEHRTTFLGALLFLLDKLYEINPKARIVFVLGSSFSYDNGKAAFKTISDRYKIGIIDIWSKVNLTPKSKVYIYSEGGTNAHPSTYAHELLGKILANELVLVI